MYYLIYISIIPVVLLLFYIYKKDVEVEPRGMLIKIFVFGCLSTVPIYFAEKLVGHFFPADNLPTFIGTLVSVFVGIGLIEELGKWIITYLTSYRNKEFNHPYDGIVYSVFASLGFAAIENLIYVVSNGIGTGIIRAILSVPSHAVDAVYMGFFLAASKKCLIDRKNNRSFIYLLLSILAPAITHTIYDGLLVYYQSSLGLIYFVLFLLFVIMTYIIAIILINKASKDNYNFDGSMVLGKKGVVKKPVVKKYCPNCGYPLTNGDCPNCDYKDN